MLGKLKCMALRRIARCNLLLQGLFPPQALRRDGRRSAEPARPPAADPAHCKAGAPSPLLADLTHLASLHNPLFYERQRLRFSTHQTPRLIRCYEETLTELHLPAGLLAQHDRAGRAAGKDGP